MTTRRDANGTAPPANGEPVQLRCVSSADRAEPKFDHKTEERLKREALQVAVLLPSSHDEALAVLAFAADLVNFISKCK